MLWKKRSQWRRAITLPKMAREGVAESEQNSEGSKGMSYVSSYEKSIGFEKKARAKALGQEECNHVSEKSRGARGEVSWGVVARWGLQG